MTHEALPALASVVFRCLIAHGPYHFSPPSSCTDLFFFLINSFIWLHWVLFEALRIFDLSCGMWDLVPWPGIKPKSSALGVWVLATGPPGKFLYWSFSLLNKLLILPRKVFLIPHCLVSSLYSFKSQLNVISSASCFHWFYLKSMFHVIFSDLALCFVWFFNSFVSWHI